MSNVKTFENEIYVIYFKYRVSKHFRKTQLILSLSIQSIFKISLKFEYAARQFSIAKDRLSSIYIYCNNKKLKVRSLSTNDVLRVWNRAQKRRETEQKKEYFCGARL